MHRFISNLRPGNRLVTDIAGDFPSAFKGGGKAFAGFANFFPGHVGGGGEKGAGVLGELADIMAGGVCFFVHIFDFSLFELFNGKFSA